MTAEEREKFADAERVAAKNYIASSAPAALPPDATPPLEKAMRARRVLEHQIS